MADSHHTIEIDGRAVPLRVRRHARARNLILRLDEGTGGAVVTIPKRTPVRDALDMAERKAGWIAAQLKRLPQPVPFAPGARIPYLDEEHIVRHDPGGRGIVRAWGEIVVAGREEHLARRLTDWLKAQAKAELTARVRVKAAALAAQRDGMAAQRDGVVAQRDGVAVEPKAIKAQAQAQVQAVGRVTVRDTRSRWGSCAADGQLNFSWRLIMAPEFVLDYVVAHEVAHLALRDHSPAFWALTEGLTGRMNEAKAWLHAHGRTLHRYG